MTGIVKMLFDKAVFVRKNADQQALILPIMVQVKDPMIGENIHVDVMDDRYDDYSQLGKTYTYKVLGQAEDGSYIIRYKVSWVSGKGLIATVAQKDCTPISQNGGGKRLLSHVYQALRRVVIA